MWQGWTLVCVSERRRFLDAHRHFAFYRHENSARRFCIFLRIVYHGSLKMLKIIFPFLSLIDTLHIWVKESVPHPYSWSGRNVSAQAVASHYSVSPISSSPVPPGHALPTLASGCFWSWPVAQGTVPVCSKSRRVTW